MSDSPTVQLRALAAGFLGRVSATEVRLVGAHLDDRIAHVLARLDAGEVLVAFEDLCENLYDFDLPVSDAEFRQIIDLAQDLELSPDEYSHIAELVRA